MNKLPEKFALLPMKFLLESITLAGISPTENPPTELKGLSAISNFSCLIFIYFHITLTAHKL
jgi:hypothetical protein